MQDGYHDLPPGKVAMVVTHLQMTAPAPLRGVTLDPDVQFRAVTPELDWYRDIFDRVGRDWLWFGRKSLTDRDLMKILEDPDVKLFSLDLDGRSEALLELDFREAGECELAYFGLTPRLIGRGAGAFLMDRAIELAWQQDIERFHVHTCTLDSPGALAFYQRSGFTPYRQQIEIADDPRLTGLLPRDAAPQVPIFEE